jgi:hypothetical protein
MFHTFALVPSEVCAVRKMAVFCSSLISSFPVMLFRYLSSCPYYYWYKFIITLYYFYRSVFLVCYSCAKIVCHWRHMYICKTLIINFTVLTCIPNLIFRIFIVVTFYTVVFIDAKVTTDFIVTSIAKVTTVPRLLCLLKALNCFCSANVFWLKFYSLSLYIYIHIYIQYIYIYIFLCDYI